MQNCLLTHRPAAPAHFDEKASRVLRFIRQLRHLHMTLSAIRPLTRTIFQSCHSTVYDALMRPGRVWLFASDPDQLNSTTIALWTTVANLTQSDLTTIDRYPPFQEPERVAQSRSMAPGERVAVIQSEIYTKSKSIADEIAKLTTLHGSGALSDTEFAIAKATVIGQREGARNLNGEGGNKQR